MAAVYRILALVCVAMIIAIASFEDRVALAIGGAGVLAAVVVCIFILVGAGLSLRRQGGREEPVSATNTQNSRSEVGDPSRPAS
jgi:hypothetical protein